jgi:imidazole glycerol-phosphate synthase subunit HisF
MFRPRVIPVILVDDRGHAVKSIRFRKPIDLGDSVNTVSLFNAFKVDELVVLDIYATRAGRAFYDGLMTNISSEARMPLAVGGGVRTCDDVHRLLNAGAEKVIISSTALAHPQFLREATDAFGTSSIVVCIDVKRDWMGRYRVQLAGLNRRADASPREAAILMEDMGAGEIIIQSVDKDGMMSGYDLELISQVADAVGVPVIALGGAGRFAHFQEANQQTHASAFASGSAFCFQDENRGVLISYPSEEELASLAKESFHPTN